MNRPGDATPAGRHVSFNNGDRVKYIGMSGRADGPTGRVIRQYKAAGVRVRWDDGRTDTVHPDGLAVIPL